MNRMPAGDLSGTRLGALTVSDAVFAFLREQGIDRVFGNPGSTELPMFVDLPEDFSYVLGLQESIVVAMADAHAQVSGRAAFVNLHSAAGLGHAMGNLYTAYRNRAPLIVTTGQQTRDLLPHDPFLFNESPVEFPKPYVKWAIEPARPEDVPAAIARAYHMAMQAPRGPVVVSVPLSDWDKPAAELVSRQVETVLGCSDQALDDIAAKLDAARKPVLVAGPGVDIDGGWDETVRLAEKLQAKVWAAPLSARCSFPERHPLFAGFLPARQPQLRDLLGDADFVLVLGAPAFTYHFPGTGGHVPEGAELCLITDDPEQIAGAVAGTAVRSNLRVAAEGLAKRTRARDRRSAEPARHVCARGGIEEDRREAVLPDAGRPALARQHHRRGGAERARRIARPFSDRAAARLLRDGERRPRLRPAGSVGAALTRPDQPVICIVGDGSSLYAIQALWSAAEYDADLLVIVLNNGGYAALKGIAKKQDIGRIDGVDIGHMDFVAIAEAQGCHAERCEDGTELSSCLEELLRRKGPRLLEVILSEEESAMNVMVQNETTPHAPEKFFIGGEWVTPMSNKTLDVISPVTEELVMRYPEASTADMDRAVAAARDAFDNGPWPRMSPSERAGYLRKVADLLTEKLDDIAHAWTLQVGAPIMLTKKLVGQNPTLFNYYADLIETYPFVDDRAATMAAR
jgi:benzoylformate decarboxylase